ncbi:MAG TPA: hypothetical protein VLM40_11415 [Gemmata sp.]|nr:hypothetical protein [Gemmata sp.]
MGSDGQLRSFLGIEALETRLVPASTLLAASQPQNLALLTLPIGQTANSRAATYENDFVSSVLASGASPYAVSLDSDHDDRRAEYASALAHVNDPFREYSQMPGRFESLLGGVHLLLARVGDARNEHAVGSETRETRREDLSKHRLPEIPPAVIAPSFESSPVQGVGGARGSVRLISAPMASDPLDQAAEPAAMALTASRAVPWQGGERTETTAAAENPATSESVSTFDEAPPPHAFASIIADCFVDAGVLRGAAILGGIPLDVFDLDAAAADFLDHLAELGSDLANETGTWSYLWLSAGLLLAGGVAHTIVTARYRRRLQPGVDHLLDPRGGDIHDDTGGG